MCAVHAVCRKTHIAYVQADLLIYIVRFIKKIHHHLRNVLLAYFTVKQMNTTNYGALLSSQLFRVGSHIAGTRRELTGMGLLQPLLAHYDYVNQCSRNKIIQ